jgi:hypothetical protein
MKSVLIAASAALIALATDGAKNGDASTAANAPAADVATDSPDVQISLSDMPLQRAGRWKIVEFPTVSLLMRDDRNNRFVCRSGKTPPLPETPACRRTVKRAALGDGDYVVESHCTLKTGGNWTARTWIAGDFQTHLSLETTPNVEADPNDRMHEEQTWVGRCRRRDFGWPGY